MSALSAVFVFSEVLGENPNIQHKDWRSDNRYLN